MASLEDALRRLVNTDCWAVVAGVGNGSRMTLHLGRKIPRAHPIQTADEPVRTFQGELCLFVQSGAWRLEQEPQDFLCTWNQPEEVIAKAMRALVGTSITSVRQLTEAHDVQVEFDGRYRLTIFCDQMRDADAMDNYSIRLPGRWYTVKAGGAVTISESKVGLEL